MIIPTLTNTLCTCTYMVMGTIYNIWNYNNINIDKYTLCTCTCMVMGTIYNVWRGNGDMFYVMIPLGTCLH